MEELGVRVSVFGASSLTFKCNSFCLTCIFHITNKIIFRIGIFPYLSLALATVYFEFDWPLRVWNATFGRALSAIGAGSRAKKEVTPKKFRKQIAGKGNEPAGSQVIENNEFVSTYKTKLMTVALFCVGCQQILYPLRHHLYPGDVTWNELGHRYSWRMKLRDKVRTLWIETLLELNQQR